MYEESIKGRVEYFKEMRRIDVYVEVPCPECGCTLRYDGDDAVFICEEEDCDFTWTNGWFYDEEA